MDAQKLSGRSSRPGRALMRSNVSDERISSVGWATHWVGAGGSGGEGSQCSTTMTCRHGGTTLQTDRAC